MRYKTYKSKHDELKRKVLTVYGHGKCACVRCGFSDIRALCIDHVNGGGTRHVKSLGKNGKTFYKWLVDNNYPLGFQTLCYNCNQIKYLEEWEGFWRNRTKAELHDEYKKTFPRK